MAGGRPSKYQPEFAEQARKLALLGATNADLAGFFSVDVTTIDEWIAKRPEFSGALKEGRAHADAHVADRLFKRATGYEHDAVKIMQYEGAVIEAPYVEHYPPDTTAAIFWLKNRRPDLWRDRAQHEHSGPDGGPILMIATGVPRNEAD